MESPFIHLLKFSGALSQHRSRRRGNLHDSIECSRVNELTQKSGSYALLRVSRC